MDGTSVQGDYARASAFYEQSLALFRGVGFQAGAATALRHLGSLAFQRGDYAQAGICLRESLTLFWEQGRKAGSAECMLDLAGIAGAQRHPAQAVRLLGALDALLEDINTLLAPQDRADAVRHLTAARALLDAAAFDAAWAAGRALPLEHAIAEALDVAQAAQPAHGSPLPCSHPPSAYPAALSEREAAVLRLVAQGLTNAQVAERLVISPRTVNAHLTAIYGKLGVPNRSGATRWAAEHQLLDDPSSLQHRGVVKGKKG